MIALTGTPLIGDGYNSKDVFGDYIHKYYYNQSIADGYTLKLIREEIETVNAEIEKAQNSYDLTKAAELKYGKLPTLQKELEEEEAIAEESSRTLLRDRVTEEEIAKIVGRWTGIPVTKFLAINSM